MIDPSGDLCRLVGIERPLFQAGMGWVSTGRLAAAVSGAGALGVIATGGIMPRAELRDHIARVREEAPGRPFGVNLLFPGGASGRDGFANPHLARIHVDVCLEERVPVAILGLGAPPSIVRELRRAGTRCVSVVGSASAAATTAADGVDAVIAQGHEAGGHVGRSGTLILAQAVLASVDVPVLVAGGIANRSAVEAVLSLGAAGVSVGTRFLASQESDAHPAYKEAVVAAGERSTAVTRACTGKPSRALRTPFVERWLDREDEIQPYPEQAREHFWRARAGALEGDLEEGFLPSGQCAALLDSVLPAAEIVERLTVPAAARP